MSIAARIDQVQHKQASNIQNDEEQTRDLEDPHQEDKMTNLYFSRFTDQARRHNSVLTDNVQLKLKAKLNKECNLLMTT